MYKWGNKFFRGKEVKIIGFAMGVVLFIAFGLYKIYPILHKLLMERICNITVPHPHKCTDGFISITEVSTKTLNIATDSIVTPEQIRLGISTIFSAADSYPLLIEHIFVLLIIMLSIFLLHLLDKKQEMKLEYEKIKVEKLQNSYNALMGQINPHFFFNSLNGLDSLIRTGEQEKPLEYLEGLSNVFRYILQSDHKTLVTLNEELNFVNAYTYLLSVRYENKLFFSIQVAEPCLPKKLPILSLLPLIENAVKHNIISMQHPLRIEIYTVSESLLVVSNPIQPKMEDYVCSGIGLKNLQGRYLMLTGENIYIEKSNGYFKVFLPLLKQLQQLQKEKKERIIVFMAAPPAVGKTTLCEFLEYLSKQDQEFTDIQALGLDGFHYHSDYINSHDAIVLGEKVPMKQVKGCPETYDTEKLRQKLEKIKIEDILWPIYDRNLHDVVEDQIKVTKDIILIEGNWLLLKQEPWKSMQQYADYKILILAEEEMLKERLISRKEKGGLTREEAVAWYQNSDSKNVKRVLKNSCRKHLNLLLQVEQDNDYLQVK